MNQKDKKIMMSIIESNIRQEDRGTIYDQGEKPVEVTMDTHIIDEEKVSMTIDDKTGNKIYSTSMANIGITVVIKNN